MTSKRKDTAARPQRGGEGSITQAGRKKDEMYVSNRPKADEVRGAREGVKGRYFCFYLRVKRDSKGGLFNLKQIVSKALLY